MKLNVVWRNSFFLAVLSCPNIPLLILTKFTVWLIVNVKKVKYAILNSHTKVIIINPAVVA